MSGWRLRSSKTGRNFRLWRNGRAKWCAIHYAWDMGSHPVFFGKTQRECVAEIEKWEDFMERMKYLADKPCPVMDAAIADAITELPQPLPAWP